MGVVLHVTLHPRKYGINTQFHNRTYLGMQEPVIFVVLPQGVAALLLDCILFKIIVIIESPQHREEAVDIPLIP